MDFKNFCDFLQGIQQTKATGDKHKLVRNQFKKWRQSFENGDKIFQIIRLMVPKLDRERDSYNMKEAKLARTFIKMLDLPSGHDKNILSNSHLMAGKALDFGEVVYSVIKKYLRKHKTTVSIDEINEFFDNLTKAKGEKESEELLMKLLKTLSSEDICWVVRIILKDLKLGMSTNSILNCYHQDAVTSYNSNNNLRKVCMVLFNESIRAHELVEIFQPFRPMLSKRIDAGNFHKELPDKKLFYLENKFDGERFQLHMKDGEFKYFSRNGFDYTDHLGKAYDSGILTPKLKGLFQDSIQSVILDGELMLWNTRTRTLGSKGMSLDVKKLTDKGPYQPCFCVYDVILLNDRIMTNFPFKKRAEALRGIFKTVKEGVMQISQIKEVNSQQEMIDELNAVVGREEEGIIVKDPESVYKYSDRKGGWYKMKLEYFQDVMNDLDLLLMGGIYSSSTCDKLNSFVLGIRSGKAENGRPLYLSIGKVASGLTDEEIDSLNKKLKNEGKKFSDFNSGNLLFGRERPHYYIEPECSIVFQVRATELIRNMDSSFKTSYTLRFPRVVKIRDDKPVDECLTINELLDLTKSNKSVIKLNKREIELSEIVKPKARRMQKKEIKILEVYSKEKVSDILENYNVWVLSGTVDFSKEKADSFIRRAGGKVSYFLKDDVDIIIAAEKSEKVRDLIKSNRSYDIVNISWLQRVINDGNLLDYEEEEVYFLGKNYKSSLADDLDSFGDSYTIDTTPDKLRRTFERIADMKLVSNFNTIEFTGFPKNFSQFVAYFDKYQKFGDKNSSVIYDSFLDELEFRYYNGTVHDRVSEDVNLIIYGGGDERKRELESYLIDIKREGVEIRSKDYIYASVEGDVN